MGFCPRAILTSAFPGHLSRSLTFKHLDTLKTEESTTLCGVIQLVLASAAISPFNMAVPERGHFRAFIGAVSLKRQCRHWQPPVFEDFRAFIGAVSLKLRDVAPLSNVTH